MPIMTYRELVVDILNDMDSDPIFDNSPLEDIASTEESRQVTQILKTTYYNLIDGRDKFWPHLFKNFVLANTGASTPTHMTIPTNAMDLEYVKYDTQRASDVKDKFRTITYMEPKAFLDMAETRNSAAPEVTKVTDPTGIFINIFNDRPPLFWTSLDDDVVIFDAHDAAVDAVNLADAKTQCRGKIYPTVTETDAFVFDLPVDTFSYLLAEAKSVCFLVIKQASNPKAEQQSNTQRRRLSQNAGTILQGIGYPNYGRSGKRRS